jgi:hypothetical protein
MTIITQDLRITTEQTNQEDDAIQKSDYIRPHDVLLGRGGAANNHLGNRLFRSIVLHYQVEYLQSKKLEKVNVARKVVSIIHSEGGRFLKRNGKDDAWEEVDLKKAQEKTSQALREGLDVRHSQIRLQKKQFTEPRNGIKPRKPYTIKKPITTGKVKTIDIDRSNELSSQKIAGCRSPIKSVDEYAAMAIASLGGRLS